MRIGPLASVALLGAASLWLGFECRKSARN